MFSIYAKNFIRNNQLVTTETLIQSVPASSKEEIHIITPTVNASMNDAGTLEFGMEKNSKWYDSFKQLKTYIRVDYDGDLIFLGRVLTISNTLFGNRKIKCEGAFTFLLDSYYPGQEDKLRPKITSYEYLQKIISNHNSAMGSDANKQFVLGEVPGHYSNNIDEQQKIGVYTRDYGSSSWTDSKAALEDLKSHYGGCFRIRSSGIGQGIYIDWLKNYFSSSVANQTIEIGKNLLDLNNTTEVNNIFTAIIPIGKNNSGKRIFLNGYRTDIHGNNNYLKVSDITKVRTASQLTSIYHSYDDYANADTNYGMIFKTVDLDEAETQEQLFNKAIDWIKDNYHGGIDNFTVKAIDMHIIGDNVSKIMVGDRVRVIYPITNASGNTQTITKDLTCLSISYDLYNPENNSYTFGIPSDLLNKTYGTKNGKSSKSNASAGSPSFSGGGGKESERPRLNAIINWLISHCVHYNGQKPYHEGNAGQSGPKFLDYDGYVGNGFLLYTAYARTTYSRTREPIPEDLENTFYTNLGLASPLGTELTIVDWVLGSPMHIQMTTDVNESLINKTHILQYIQQEYGLDFIGGSEEFGIPGGSPVSDDGDGNVTVWKKTENGTYPGTVYTNDGEILELTTYDGQHVVVVKTTDGGYEYINDQGQSINIRDLHISSINTATKVGWIVTEGQDGNLEFANPGEITSAIEKYERGELVVTRVSGELLYLGNTKTQQLTAVSLNHMDQVCGDVEYTTGDNGVKVLNIKSAGGMRVRRGTIDPSTGQFVRDNQGNIVYTDYGLYDDNNLTAGILVTKLNDNSTNLKIKASRLEVETNKATFGMNPPSDPSDGDTWFKGSSVRTWNEIEDDLWNVYDIGYDWSDFSGLTEVLIHKNGDWVKVLDKNVAYYSDIKATKEEFSVLRGQVENIEGQYVVTNNSFNITAKQLKSEISDNKGNISILRNTTKGLEHEVMDADGSFSRLSNTVDGVKATVGDPDSDNPGGIIGSALWTQRDQITGVSGKFHIEKNQDGSERLVIDEGGGFKVRKNNVEYGIYDQDNLTGGLIVEKVNNTTTTQIKGTRIILGSLGENNDTLDNWAKTALNGTGVFAKFLTVKELTAEQIETMLANIGHATIGDVHTNTLYADALLRKGNNVTWSVSADGAGSFSSVLGNAIYQKTNNGNVQLKIADITKSTNTLKITKTDGTTINFSRATSLSGSWSGSDTARLLTISTDDSNVPSLKIGFGNVTSDHHLDIGVSQTVTPTATATQKMLKFKGVVNEASDSGLSQRYSRDLTVDASPIYDQGWTAAAGKVKLPSYPGNDDSLTSEMKLSYPSSTVDATNNRYYCLQVTDSYVYIRDTVTSGYKMARLANTGYTNGYNSGYDAGHSASNVSWSIPGTPTVYNHDPGGSGYAKTYSLRPSLGYNYAVFTISANGSSKKFKIVCS